MWRVASSQALSTGEQVISVCHRDKYSKHSQPSRALPHARPTPASSTMSAFVQSAFTTGGSTFVRARPQTRRAPATRVSALSASPSHTSHGTPDRLHGRSPTLVRRLQASGRVSLRVQAIAEGRQSLFVAVTVKSGKMEEYEKLIKRHSESSQPKSSIVCFHPSNPTNAQV